MIIPPKGRDALLRGLHDTHPGIVKMKALARSYLWWPVLDMEIERRVKDCNACQIYSGQPDLLRQSVQDNVLHKQTYDKQRHDTHAAERTFMTGDSAWALNFQGKPEWMPTVIESQLGPLTFTVRLSDGRLWKRHQDHLRERRHDRDRVSWCCTATPGSSASTAATASVNIHRQGKRCHTSDICDNERFSTCTCTCSGIASGKPYASS